MSNGLGGGLFETGTPYEPVTMNKFMPGGAVYAAPSGGLKVNVTGRTVVVSGGFQLWDPVADLVLVDNALQYVCLEVNNYNDPAFKLPTVLPSIPTNLDTIVLAQVQTTGGAIQFINQLQERVRNLASTGVNSLAVTSPVQNDGTATDPIISMPAATNISPGHATPFHITKLLGIEDNADVTDSANVSAAGALMSSLFPGGLADLLIGTATPGVPTILPGGAVGSFLQRIAGAPGLQWTPQSSFVPQILMVPCDAMIGAGVLPYNSYRFQKAFEIKSGSIEVDAVNQNLINIPVPGKYFFISMIMKQRGNFAGSMQWNIPANPQVNRGRSNYNTGGGFKLVTMITVGGFDGTGQLALRDDTNDGYNGAVQDNMVAVIKLAD